MIIEDTTNTNTRILSTHRDRDVFPIILAIDPSMRSLGWACYNLNLKKDRYDIQSDAWRFGVVHPQSRNESCQYKWENACYQLKAKLDDWKPTHFASEYPTFFGNTRGKICAMQGYTLDIAGMVGYLAGRFYMPPERIALWKPDQWKGMVPKTVTQAKFVRLFGKGADYIVRNYSDDVTDALMICEHWLSLYYRQKFSWQQKLRAASVKL